MEIYFKLSFTRDKEDLAIKINKALHEMAARCEEFPDGDWPESLRCGAKIDWFRNPIEWCGIQDVMDYYEIFEPYSPCKTIYIEGRSERSISLYSFLKRQFKRNKSLLSYDKKEERKYYKKIINVLDKLIMFCKKQAGEK